MEHSKETVAPMYDNPEIVVGQKFWNLNGVQGSIVSHEDQMGLIVRSETHYFLDGNMHSAGISQYYLDVHNLLLVGEPNGAELSAYRKMHRGTHVSIKLGKEFSGIFIPAHVTDIRRSVRAFDTCGIETLVDVETFDKHIYVEAIGGVIRELQFKI